MDRFRTALTTWMDKEAHISLRTLATLAEVDSSAISRIRNGDGGVSPRVLYSLLLAVRGEYGNEIALRLLIAHLRDETPEPFQASVVIEAAKSLRSDDTLPPVDKALAWFARRAEQDSDFAAWIIQFYSICQPPENTQYHTVSHAVNRA
jgi:transcriptional regulator with XRE-family HTH domain